MDKRVLRSCCVGNKTLEKISERKLVHKLWILGQVLWSICTSTASHRDVKAKKVMLLHASRSEGLDCKLIEFGLAVRCLGFDVCVVRRLCRKTSEWFLWFAFASLINDWATCGTRGWGSSMGKLRSDFCQLHLGRIQRGNSESCLYFPLGKVSRGKFKEVKMAWIPQGSQVNFRNLQNAFYFGKFKGEISEWILLSVFGKCQW